MGNVAIWWNTYDFLFNFIETMLLSYIVLDIASYLSKVADFNLQRLQLAPPLGVITVEFR